MTDETTDTEMTYVPSDYEYLEPGRPDIVSEADLTPEERERDAEQIAAMHEREAQGWQGWHDGPRFDLGGIPAAPPPPRGRRRRKGGKSSGSK